MALEDELQAIYNSEINLEIGWFWDSGITIKLGDLMNGYLVQTEVRTAAEILPWLQRAIARHFPDSAYIKSLGPNAPPPPEPETHAPPSCSYRCTSCGEVNVFPGWSEMTAFICKVCGEPESSQASMK